MKVRNHCPNKKLLVIHLVLLVGLLNHCKSELSFHRKGIVEKQNNNKNLQTDLQSVLDEVVKETKVSGVQLSIKFENEDAINLQSGSADVKRKVRLTQSHVMSWGSVTKMFCSTLILKLIEKENVKPDSITIYKMDSPIFRNQIVLQLNQLLSHRSGIQNYMQYIPGLVKSFYYKYHWKSDDLIKIASKGKLLFEPGSNFSYSNTNFVMLGRIAEKIMDKPLNELFREQFFKPYNLQNIYFPPFDSVPVTNAVFGVDKNFIPVPGKYVHKPNHKGWSSFANAAGAIAGTSADMVKFMDLLVSNEIINHKLLDKMTIFEKALVRDVPEQREYGLGLQKILIDDEEYWGHIGSYIGFSGILIYSPKYKYSIALSCNYSIFQTSSIIKEIQKE
ncbi:MAG: beta-lactamase family protein [Chloroflexia bacterium]|nr:beta-lactamase family protein [Chloroflexia bacterium]